MRLENSDSPTELTKMTFARTTAVRPVVPAAAIETETGDQVGTVVDPGEESVSETDAIETEIETEIMTGAAGGRGHTRDREDEEVTNMAAEGITKAGHPGIGTESARGGTHRTGIGRETGTAGIITTAWTKEDHRMTIIATAIAKLKTQSTGAIETE